MLELGLLILLAPVVYILLNVSFVVYYYACKSLLLVVLVAHDWMELLEGLLHAIQCLHVAQIRRILTGFFVS